MTSKIDSLINILFDIFGTVFLLTGILNLTDIEIKNISFELDIKLTVIAFLKIITGLLALIYARLENTKR